MTALDTLNGHRTGRYIIHTADRRQWEIDLDIRSAWCGGVYSDLVRLIEATVGEPLRLVRSSRDIAEFLAGAVVASIRALPSPVGVVAA